MDAKYDGLLRVLLQARAYLALEDNDFTWSSWEDQDAATAEIDELIRLLRQDILPATVELEVLFTVAGPIQEVSLSSGWSKQFLTIATEFDKAMGELSHEEL